MLRWMSGVTIEGRIRNEYIRESIGVASIMDKLRENKLRLFGHVMRRKDLEAVRSVMELSVEGKRGFGRLKKKKLIGIECDMRTAAVCVNYVEDRFK